MKKYKSLNDLKLAISDTRKQINDMEVNLSKIDLDIKSNNIDIAKHRATIKSLVLNKELGRNNPDDEKTINELDNAIDELQDSNEALSNSYRLKTEAIPILQKEIDEMNQLTKTYKNFERAEETIVKLKGLLKMDKTFDDLFDKLSEYENMKSEILRDNYNVGEKHINLLGFSSFKCNIDANEKDRPINRQNKGVDKTLFKEYLKYNLSTLESYCESISEDL